MYRTMRTALLALLCLGIFTPTANAEGLESQGQLLVTFGRTFADFQLSEQVTGGVYAHATVLVPITSTPQMFGYVGPEISFGDANLKFLTGTLMTSDGGLSLIGSIWYNQSLPHDLNLFLKADAYFPVDGDGVGHEIRQYYTLANFSWEVNKDSGLGFGLMQENFFNESGEWFEAAVGPVLNFSKGNFWIAYDFTPEVKGDHSLVLRLSINL